MRTPAKAVLVGLLVLGLVTAGLVPGQATAGHAAVEAEAPRRTAAAGGAFGTCGVVELPTATPGGTWPRFVRVLPHEGGVRLLHAGHGSAGIGILALDGAGRVDRSFGRDGWWQAPAGGVSDVTAASAMDGSLVVAAGDGPRTRVFTLDATGREDTPAGGLILGSATAPARPVAVAYGGARALVLLDDGRATVVSVRDGAVESGWGVLGRALLQDDDVPLDLDLDADGRPHVLVGRFGELGVVRLATDGSPSPDYGIGGFGGSGASTPSAAQLGVAPEGRTRILDETGLTVTALTVSGGRDPDHGADGVVEAPFPGVRQGDMQGFGVDAVARTLHAAVVRDDVPRLVVARRTTRGGTDPAFSGGEVGLDLTPGVAVDAALGLTGDDAVLALPVTGTESPHAQLLVRVEPDGVIGPGCAQRDPAVARLAGDDRFATAAAVSRSAFSTASTVVVATGRDFPDALSGGPAAAALGGPLLLVDRDAVPAATRDELTRLRPDRIVIVGGAQAVSEAVESRLRELASRVDRVSGTTRHATAAAVARAFFPTGADRAYLATGDAFPDALAVGSFAGRRRAPILLSAPGELSPETAAALDHLAPRQVVLVGGPAALSGDVERQVGHRTPVTRVAGQDRYATARAVALAELARPEVDPYSEPLASTAWVATGVSFPDALAAGPVAALTGSPLLLTRPDRLAGPSRDGLAVIAPQRVVLVGGESALSPTVLAGLTAANLGHRFVDHRDGAPFEHPVRWNPCEPIRWQFHDERAPAGGLEMLEEAIAIIEAETGLTFAFQGHTSSSPMQHQPVSSDGAWSPVVIGWDAMGPDGLVGYGDLTYTDGVAVTGTVTFNSDLSDIPMSFSPRGWGVISMHELGHLVGLAHVPSRAIMHPTMGRFPDTEFTPADRAGLRRLGSDQGCLTTPAPPR